jgi:peptidyl-prolyl cis-trans isomerase SurA
VVVDRIVAVVNGEIITLSDVLREERRLRQLSTIPEQTPAVNREILDRLIERSLLLQLAEKKKIQLPEEQLQAALTDVAHQYGAEDVNQLEQALTQQGLTLEELKREIENQIKTTKLINTEVRAKILITQAEVEEYYQQHLGDYQEREERSARHILLPLPPDASSEEEARVKQQAQDIVARLNQGADFERLAESVSRQSETDLGYFSRGQLMPQLEQAIWDLQPGRITVVRTPLGYHVVQVTGRRIHTLENDPRIRQEIENILFQQKLKRQTRSWLDNLRQRATIEIMP